MSKAMRQVELLRAACCVAGADGETSDREMRALQQLADQAGVGDASLAAMIECAETDDEFYKAQFRVVSSDPEKALKLLFKVAIIDGKLRKTEAVMLKRLALRLNVDPDQFDDWLQQSIAAAKRKSSGTQ